ncbi:MAG: hypothetical protein HGB20_01255 [Chlorobiaceae bacterium]|nr:hypothetical protein [Chlorobiaceae bacterium]
MNKAKNLVLGSAILAALSCPLTATGALAGRATSGQTNVTASVPEFIILHYYSNIALNFITPDTEAIDQGDNSLKVTWAGESSEGNDLAKNLKTASLELDGNKTNVKLNNVWAVRGFSSGGTANVAILLDSDKMVLNGSEIGISNAQVTDDKTTSASITTKLGGITKAGATLGGVQMDLDFTKTTLSGNHTGGKYTITATTI